MNIREMLIDYELDQMSRYLDLVQESLQQNYDQLKRRYAEIGDWESAGFDDELIEATQDFPQLLLLSFIVIWYSFVEQKLLELCEELKLRISIGAKDNEKFDTGIRRARKFQAWTYHDGWNRCSDSSFDRVLRVARRTRQEVISKALC